MDNQPKSLRASVEIDKRGGWVIAAIIAALALLGGSVSAILWQYGNRTAEDSERDSMKRLVEHLDSEIRLLKLGFSGTDLLVSSGVLNSEPLDDELFKEFASQLITSTRLRAVGFEPYVSHAQRAAFESSSGLKIVDSTARGYVRAPDRAWYLPVQLIQPLTAQNRAILGFDIAADKVRGATAREAIRSSDLEFSTPVKSRTSMQTALFVVKAFVVNEVPLGTVSSAIDATDLVGESSLLLPKGTRISIFDGKNSLYGTINSGGRVQPMGVGSRTWKIRVDHPKPDHSSAISTAFSTLGATTFIGFLLIKFRRNDIELIRVSNTVSQMSQLGELLANYNTCKDVLGTASSQLIEPVNAALGAILLTTGEVVIDSGTDIDTGSEAEDADLSFASAPLFKALESVIVNATSQTSLPQPLELNSSERSTFKTILALPLIDDQKKVIGAIGWAWHLPDQSDRHRLALDAMRVLWQRNLVRTLDLETEDLRTHSLYALGKALSVARTTGDIAISVASCGPEASGFDSATVVPIEQLNISDDNILNGLKQGLRSTFQTADELDKNGTLRDIAGKDAEALTLLPLLNSSSQLLGVVAFASATGPPIKPGNLLSIADLVAQTLERAQLFQQQNEVVLLLQQRNLPPVGPIPGVQVSAHYEPAAQGLGIGGDWYNIEILPDDRLLLVVGDIVGHGIDAVVDMVEISGMISALSKTESDLSNLAQKVFELFDDPGQQLSRMATAVVMKVDLVGRTAQYVRLGHLPPMIVDASGNVTSLEDASYGPVGVEPLRNGQGEIDLESGSMIVLYTDGLIERRHENIDVGIGRLISALSVSSGSTTDETVNLILSACGTEHVAFDDVALLVVKVD